MIKGNRQINKNITLLEKFTLEKMEDIFIEVIFNYEDFTWKGALPIFMVYQGFIIKNDSELDKFAISAYQSLNPLNKQNWIDIKNDYWSDKEHGPTYNVLNSLLSGNWECRVCGPVPAANPQPSARLRDLKKHGYTICSKRMPCKNCKKTTMHDILIMIPRVDSSTSAKVKTVISNKLKKRIKTLFNNKEACFDTIKTDKELIIDHKFPSQRWTSSENENPDSMTDCEIRDKFQLLTNQTNLLKSRFCDRCVSENIRGNFMGITWFYEGNETWQGEHKSDENGCVGCPWYDLEKWKKELSKKLSND